MSHYPPPPYTDGNDHRHDPEGCAACRKLADQFFDGGVRAEQFKSPIIDAALAASPAPEPTDAQIVAFAKALFAEVPKCTGCDFDHGWDDHVLAVARSAGIPWSGAAPEPTGLDAAWAAVEPLLKHEYGVEIVPNLHMPRKDGAWLAFQIRDVPGVGTINVGQGDTPEAALRALAARLTGEAERG